MHTRTAPTTVCGCNGGGRAGRGHVHSLVERVASGFPLTGCSAPWNEGCGDRVSSAVRPSHTVGTLGAMLKLAGVPLGRRTVLRLATMLRRHDHDHAADTLQGAIATSQTEVVLTPRERAAIVAVLHDPPQDLARLRAVLVDERS